MEPNDFYRLFAETGEPLYWLLSRCGECGAPKKENAEALPESPAGASDEPPLRAE